ncbi:hypothetical protein [Desulfosporosinus fructosivorans]|uniref:hypothetical protein n=1 Tax=Desulfosporosinus fructosivorans TaxID=2018669 RepID=UPI0018EEB60A|nr:hypothetical protein [Desulfosporosinus fructosivorans]
MQADAYNSIKTNQAPCDGTGTARIGSSMGAGFGQSQGMAKELAKAAALVVEWARF